MGFVRCLGQLESKHGIRVTTVAPGIVKTPIWTGEKLVMVTAEDEWVSSEDVARVIMVESGRQERNIDSHR